MERFDVVTVGAGLAGLSCARELRSAGGACVVLERARGVGGRCATRRFDDQPVDIGPAFLQCGPGALEAIVRELPPGLASPGWPVRAIGRRLACNPEAFADDRERTGRGEGVTALPKWLARDLDVRLSHTVRAIEPVAGGVRVEVAGGDAFEAPTVVLAGATSQTLRLLDPLAAADPSIAAALAPVRAIREVATLVTIAGYRADAPEPDFEAWHPLETTMVQAIYHDSSKRTLPRWRVLVLHGRPRFSLERMDLPPEGWSRELLWEAAELMGEWVLRPEWTGTHRWKYARVRRGDELGAPRVLRTTGGGTIVLAGDAFSREPGLEGAFESGRMAAAKIVRPGATLGDAAR